MIAFFALKLRFYCFMMKNNILQNVSFFSDDIKLLSINKQNNFNTFLYCLFEVFRMFERSRTYSHTKTKKSEPIKTETSCMRSYESEEFSKISNKQINDAFHKFTELNTQYKIQTDYRQLCLMDDSPEQKNRDRQKINNFTIMAKLRHLENKAEISRVDQQMDKIATKKSKAYLSNKKGLKDLRQGQMNKGQPYLTTYKNFLKQSIENGLFERTSTQHDSQAEQIESNQEEKELSEKIQFINSLKPYKSILSYTKYKMQQRDNFLTQNSPQIKKKRTLTQMKKQKNIRLVKQYQKIANKSSMEHNQRRKIEIQATKIVNKNMKKIYQKKNWNQEQDQEGGFVMTERCMKFIQKQKKILDQNQQLPNSSLLKVQKKFKGLVNFLSKTEDVNNKGRKRPMSVGINQERRAINIHHLS